MNVLARDAGVAPADLTTIARALGAPTRLAILRVLADRVDSAGLTVPDLVKVLGRSERSVAIHLRHLRRTGVVIAQRRSHATHYSIAPTPLGQTVMHMLAPLGALPDHPAGPPTGDAEAAHLADGFVRDPLVRRLLDTLPLNVMVWEVADTSAAPREFIVRLVNASYLESRGGDLDASDIEGRDYALVVPDEIREYTLESLRHVRATGEPVLGQIVDHADREGKPRHYFRSLVPIADERAGVRFIVGITVDVTERLEAEAKLAESHEQLQEALAQRDAFVAVATHELKSPLSALIMSLQLVERRVAKVITDHPDVALNEVLDRQRKGYIAARRLDALVNELLDISRVHAGKIDLDLAPSDLVAVAREAVEEQCELTGRVIDTELPDAPVTIMGDVARLAQVVTNLLTNAIKYSQADRPVHLSVRPTDGEVVLAVRDEGQGIPPEAQDHIFDRFYRVDGVQVLSGTGIGLGVGLSIAAEFVKRHGGRIWVESVVGQGSTFFVALPTHEAPMTSVGTSASESSGTAAR